MACIQGWKSSRSYDKSWTCYNYESNTGWLGNDTLRYLCRKYIFCTSNVFSLFHYNNMDEFLRLQMNASVSLALSPNSVEASQKVFFSWIYSQGCWINPCLVLMIFKWMWLNVRFVYNYWQLQERGLRNKTLKIKSSSNLIALWLTESFVFDRHRKNLNQLDGNKSQLWNICKD